MLTSEQIAGYFGPDQVTELGYDNTLPRVQTLIAQYTAFADYLNKDLEDGAGKDAALDHLASSFESACASAQPIDETAPEEPVVAEPAPDLVEQ